MIDAIVTPQNNSPKNQGPASAAMEPSLVDFTCSDENLFINDFFSIGDIVYEDQCTICVDSSIRIFMNTHGFTSFDVVGATDDWLLPPPVIPFSASSDVLSAMRFPDRVERVEPVLEPIQKLIPNQSNEELTNLIAHQLGTPDDVVSRINFGVTKISAYVVSILVCTTMEQYLAATVQFFLSFVSGPKIVEYLKSRMPFTNQGPSDLLATLLKFVRGARGLNSSFFDSPLYRFFTDAIGIASVCGICESISCGDLIIVSQAFAKRAAGSVVIDFPSAILRAVEFSLEVASDFFAGVDLKKFVFGRGILVTASELLAQESDFRRGKLQQNYGISDLEYSARIVHCLLDMRDYITKSYGVAKSVAIAQAAKLSTLKAEVAAKVGTAGVRKRPFCVLLTGDSAVGKSTLINYCTTRLGAIFKVPVEPKNISTVVELDKYDSMDGQTTTIIMDDMCNARNIKNLAETPSAKLIRFNNVVESPAIKADLIDKNQIMIQPDFIFITSHHASLNAARDSINADSILNRINLTVSVQAKSYCRKPNNALDSSRVDRTSAYLPQEVCEMKHDVGDGKVTSTLVGEYENFEDYFVRRIIPAARNHRAQQEEDHQRTLKSKEPTLCEHCFYDKPLCTCCDSEDLSFGPSLSSEDDDSSEYDDEDDDDDDEPIANQGLLVPLARRIVAWAQPAPTYQPAEVGMAMIRLLTFTTRFIDEAGMLSRFCYDRYARIATNFVWSFMEVYDLMITVGVCMYLAVVYYLPFQLTLAVTLFILYTMYCVVYTTHIVARDVVVESLTTSTPLAAYGILDGILMLPAVAVGFGMVRMLNTTYQNFTMQGNIAPTSMDEVEERNQQPNEWYERSNLISEVISAKVNHTATLDHVKEKVIGKTHVLSVPHKDDPLRTVKCCVLQVYGNYILVPKHSFKVMNLAAGGNLMTHGTHRKKSLPRNNNRVHFLMGTLRNIRNDHVAIAVSGIPNTGDIRHLFAESISPGILDATIVLPERRDEDQPVILAEYKQQISMVAGTISGFQGRVASGTETTRRGDCGCAWISNGRQSKVIIGIHNGGLQSLVVCEAVLRSDLDCLSEKIVHKQGDVEYRLDPPPPLVEIPLTMYDEDLYVNDTINERSCVNFGVISDSGQTPIFEVYGGVDGTRSSMHSQIVDTPLSSHLEEEGLPQLWGQPQVNPNVNFAAVFQQAQHTMLPIHDDALQWAIQDYVEPMVAQVHSLSYYFSVLTGYEIFNGRNVFGQTVKPMNMKTSPGLGLHGTKAEHMDLSMDENGAITYTPKEYVQDEIERVSDLLRQGNRSAPISKGALKDEPTLKGKTKVRVFFVMPLAFLAIGRMLLCPILAFLVANPLLSENFYGVRTTTDEWAQVYDHLNTFGGTRMFNGDYKSYDQKLSSQLIWAVGCVFYAIGQAMGYDNESLTMIHAWMADVAQPVYAFNGTLMSYLGYQPSGNSATVAINGIGNCLIHRAFFYYGWCSNYGKPPAVGTFRQYAKMGFVGDDSIGGINPDITSWFNMIAFRDWLADLGMTYTMPDKTDNFKPYLSLEEASLCKRSFRVIDHDPPLEGLTRSVLAPIEPNSVFKSLHNFHTSQEFPWAILSGNVSQGLRELARHPRTVFEDAQGRISRAYARASPSTAPGDLDWTYDQWQRDIHQRYVNKIPESNNFIDDMELDALLRAEQLCTIYE